MGTRGDAGFFGVYCPGRREVYLVPGDGAPERPCSLRVPAVKNGQVSGIRWAADYRIDGPAVPPE